MDKQEDEYLIAMKELALAASGMLRAGRHDQAVRLALHMKHCAAAHGRREDVVASVLLAARAAEKGERFTLARRLLKKSLRLRRLPTALISLGNVAMIESRLALAARDDNRAVELCRTALAWYREAFRSANDESDAPWALIARRRIIDAEVALGSLADKTRRRPGL